MPVSDYKILIVDDEEDILEIVGFNLRKAGYQVYTANSANIALELAKKLIPQVIILDIMMFGKDGIELCIEIRKIPFLSDSIISFFTARSEIELKELALGCGAHDYITKPIRPNELVNRVHELVRLYISSPSSKH
jgi:two-component system, OmpR family, alkaline phosphatase synthesis response regulator PhoP